jgi:hypothetical protein
MVSATSARRGTIARTGLVLAMAVAIVAAAAGSAFAATVNVRIETPERTIFAGPVTLGASTVIDEGGVAHVESNNAMSALERAAQWGAFPLAASYSQYGAFIDAIDGVEPIYTAESPDYWVLRINGAESATGASGATLKNGDTVLEYAGADTASPTAALVPAPYVAVNSTATITAEQLDPSGVASVLADAAVYAGSKTATSGPSGTAGFRFATPGDYGVRVDRDGYIRSALSVLHVRYATSISALKASKTSVKRGAKVTFSGTITGVGKAASGRIVMLVTCKRGSKSWIGIVSSKAGSTGGFKFSVKVSKSSYYRAVFVGDDQFGVATGASRLITVR